VAAVVTLGMVRDSRTVALELVTDSRSVSQILFA
jgi:hypothetical protein